MKRKFRLDFGGFEELKKKKLEGVDEMIIEYESDSENDESDLVADLSIHIKKCIDKYHYLNKSKFEAHVIGRIESCIEQLNSNKNFSEQRDIAHGELFMLLRQIFGRNSSTEEMIYLFIRMSNEIQQVLLKALLIMEKCGVFINYKFQLFSNMISEDQLEKIKQCLPSNAIQFDTADRIVQNDNDVDIEVRCGQLSHLDMFFWNKHKNIIVEIRDRHQIDNSELREYGDFLVSLCLMEKKIMDYEISEEMAKGTYFCVDERRAIKARLEVVHKSVSTDVGKLYTEHYLQLFGNFERRSELEVQFISFMMKNTKDMNSVHEIFFKEHGVANEYIRAMALIPNFKSLIIEDVPLWITHFNLEHLEELFSKLETVNIRNSITTQYLFPRGCKKSSGNTMVDSKSLKNIIFHTQKTNAPILWHLLKGQFKSRELECLEISFHKMNECSYTTMSVLQQYIDAMNKSVFKEIQQLRLNNIGLEDENIRDIMRWINKMEYRKKFHLEFVGNKMTEKSLMYINDIDSEILSFQYGYSTTSEIINTKEYYENCTEIINALLYGKYEKFKVIVINIDDQISESSKNTLLKDFSVKSTYNAHAKKIHVKIGHDIREVSSYRTVMNGIYYDIKEHFPAINKLTNEDKLKDTKFFFQ